MSKIQPAFIVVDVQNDFADPQGNLYVNGGDSIISRINEHLDYSVNPGDTVVYTQDWHPAVTTHFADHGGDWPAHCIADTWGSELHPDLRVLPGAVRIRKGADPGEDGYSGFTSEVNGEHRSTGLHEALQAKGVTHVDIVGIAFDVCVKATALDAARLGYDTAVFYSGCTASVFPDKVQEVIQELRDAGVMVI